MTVIPGVVVTDGYLREPLSIAARGLLTIAEVEDTGRVIKKHFVSPSKKEEDFILTGLSTVLKPRRRIITVKRSYKK